VALAESWLIGVATPGGEATLTARSVTLAGAIDRRLGRVGGRAIADVDRGQAVPEARSRSRLSDLDDHGTLLPAGLRLSACVSLGAGGV
jgi:hypothetical protein